MVSATGNWTRCEASIIHGWPSGSKPATQAIPKATTTSGAGMPLARVSFQRFQIQSSTSDPRPTTIAPGWRSPTILSNSENVFSRSGWKNDISPS